MTEKEVKQDKLQAYNTESFEDAIIKASKYYKPEEHNGMTYAQWCMIVKTILENESKYTSGFIPSPEQYRALLTMGKRTLIDACPGSGKTATLIFRVFLDGAAFQMKANKQLVITYTNAAATEMDQRYTKLCSRYNAYPSANISTIHSFARTVETALSYLDVLDPNGMEVEVMVENEDLDDEYEDMEVAGPYGSMDFLFEDEPEVEIVRISDRDFISDAINELQLPYDYIQNINNIETWIATIIEKDIQTEEEFNNIVEFSSLENIYLSDLLKIHRLTKEYRLKYGVMNFSDMLVGLHERLSRTEKISDINNMVIRNLLEVDVIYVDEYQDISPLQFKIIQELLRLNPGARLFAVGDADQAIYSFRGAFTGFLVDFEKYFTSNTNWKQTLYSGIEETRAELEEKSGLGDLGLNLQQPTELNWTQPQEEKRKYREPGYDKYEVKDGDSLVGVFMSEMIEETRKEQGQPTEDPIKLQEEEHFDSNKVTEDDVDIIYFTINRRCGKEIIDLANDLIVNNKYRYPKEMRPYKEEPSNIVVSTFKKDTDVRDLIVSSLEKTTDEKEIDYSKYAIIYREHRQGLELAVDLIANDVPLKVKKGVLPFNFREMRDIMGIFDMVINSTSPVMIERYLYKVCASVNKNKAKYIAEMMMKEGKPFSHYMPKTTTAMRDLNRLRIAYLALSGLPIDDSKEVWTEEDKRKALNATIDDICKAHVKHFLAYFSSNGYKVESVSYYLQSLKATDLYSLKQINEKIAYSVNMNASNNNGMSLTTMHGAKGLEFENVFILPVGNSTMYKEKIVEKMGAISKDYVKEYEEEERRLLYVAITRAKKNLYIFLESETDMYAREIVQHMRKI